MKIYMLAIHRKESYPGEYAPEILCAVDEFTNEENPDWYAEHRAKELEVVKDDISGYADITIEVDMDAVLAKIHPDWASLPGKVVES